MTSRWFLTSSLMLMLVAGCGFGGDNDTALTAEDSNGPTSQTNPSTSGDTSAGMSETGNPTTNASADETSGSTSPGGTETTEPTGTATEVMMTFIVETTGGGGGTIECDNWAQDCPDGQKCSAYAANGGTSWDSLKCVPVAVDPKQPGDECTVEGSGVSGLDDCDLGSYCWDTNAENIGACVALCKGSPDAASCDDPTKTCAIYNDGVLNLCLDSCDPLAQDCLMSDDVCINNPSGDGFLCVLDASGEEGQQHDPCEFANSCDPGLICLNSTAANECDPAASGCCEPFCDLTDPDADANCMGVGQVCTTYYEEGTAPPGQENIGYCALPAP